MSHFQFKWSMRPFNVKFTSYSQFLAYYSLRQFNHHFPRNFLNLRFFQQVLFSRSLNFASNWLCCCRVWISSLLIIISWCSYSVILDCAASILHFNSPTSWHSSFTSFLNIIKLLKLPFHSIFQQLTTCLPYFHQVDIFSSGWFFEQRSVCFGQFHCLSLCWSFS